MKPRIAIVLGSAMLALAFAGCRMFFSSPAAKPASTNGYGVEVRFSLSGGTSGRSLIGDNDVTSVEVTVYDSGGSQIGYGSLAKGASYWYGTIGVGSYLGSAIFIAVA